MTQETNQTQRPCPQDCRKCSFQQHAFCSAQMSYTLVGALNAMSERLSRIEASIGGGAVDFADPMKAQQGSGATEIGSQDNQC